MEQRQETTEAVPSFEVIRLQEKAELRKSQKSGANWFFWIAGLSMVNTVIIMSGGDWSFIVGLGITQVIDALAQVVTTEAASGGVAFSAVALVANLLIAGLFAMFGVWAGQGQKWIFVTGMVLYALDGLLFVLIFDFLSIAFHCLALYCLFGGFKACQKLSEIGRQQPTMPGVPQQMVRN